LPDIPNSTKIAYDPSGDQKIEGLPEVLDGYLYAPGTIDLKPFGRIKTEDFQNTININFTFAINSLQQVINLLRKSSGTASVVMFSTVAVVRGMPFHSSISAAKGAVEGFIRAMAAEFAPRIRFNAIAPSLVETKLASNLLNSDPKKKVSIDSHPLKRIGTSQDIANAASYLLSDDSSWMTGQVLHIDGGISSLK